MKRKTLQKAFAIALVSSMVLPANAVPVFAQDTFADTLSESFQIPEMKYRPYARWWLAEGSHTDETLREAVKQLYDAGYGGIEFLTLDESQYLDNENYAWGSKEWIHDSKLIIEECEKLGMSVSMTSGTHWATANLTVINPDMQAASQELGYTVTTPFKGSYNGELELCGLPDGSTKRRLVSVVAAKIISQTDEKTMLDMDSLTVVDSDKISTSLDENDNLLSVNVDYTAPDDGDYALYAFYQYGTGEYFTPASTGKSYTINYMAKDGADALIKYWDENVLTDEVQDLINRIDECDMYMDSLELNCKGPNRVNVLWSEQILDEFKNRTNYDLEKYLPLLVESSGGGWGNTLTYPIDAATEKDQKTSSDIRRDFYQVCTELYSENCLDVLSEWLHGKNMRLRAENSYGKMLEVSQPVKSLDYVETESFEFGNELDSYRMMSGAAHIYDKRFSSETGAFWYSNYLYNTGYYNQVFYMQYAAGIQKTITHGYSTKWGPVERVAWPGYEGMSDVFSERFNERQPGFTDYPDLNMHFSRIQKALEQGTAKMDVLILRNDYDLDNCTYVYGRDKGDDFYDNYDNMTHNHEGIYWRDMELQDAGYTYEYASPLLLEDMSCTDNQLNADGVGYQAVIVMESELPYTAAEKLLEFAKAGLPILFVNNTQEIIGDTAIKINTTAASTTGNNDGKDAELAELVEEIKSYDNVKTVKYPIHTYEAMKDLNVNPRAEFTEPTENILTALRKTDDGAYLYVYNYMYKDKEAYTGQIAVDGIYQPYILDTWSGNAAKDMYYDIQDNKTLLNVTLQPGECRVYALNSSDVSDTSVTQAENVYSISDSENGLVAAISNSGSATVTLRDGSTIETEADVPENINLDNWNLVVDSFTPGEQELRTEENPETGLTTTEASFKTTHTDLDAGTLSELVSWDKIENVGEDVSGIGTYTNTFTLPDNWNTESNGAVFNADSFNQGTASLWINGNKISIDMDTATADISDFVVPGENTIEVRVTSSLCNIMRKVGYIIGQQGNSDSSSGSYSATVGGWKVNPETAEYGMTGNTTITTYTKVSLN